MECCPLLRLLDRDPAVKRLGVGRERIRLQSAMRPEVELQLGGRTGSVEGKADRSEPVLPLRSVLTAEASLYSLFIPDLAARGECRPWPRPPSPLSKKVGPLVRATPRERVRVSRATFCGARARRPCAKRDFYARRPQLCSTCWLQGFKGPISRTVCVCCIPGLE